MTPNTQTYPIAKGLRIYVIRQNQNICIARNRIDTAELPDSIKELCQLTIDISTALKEEAMNILAFKETLPEECDLNHILLSRVINKCPDIVDKLNKRDTMTIYYNHEKICNSRLKTVMGILDLNPGMTFNEAILFNCL